MLRRKKITFTLDNIAISLPPGTSQFTHERKPWESSFLHITVTFCTRWQQTFHIKNCVKNSPVSNFAALIPRNKIFQEQIFRGCWLDWTFKRYTQHIRSLRIQFHLKLALKLALIALKRTETNKLPILKPQPFFLFFSGVLFSREPMIVPETRHVPYRATHAQTCAVKALTSGQRLCKRKAGSCKAQILETREMRVDFLQTRSELFRKQVR